jgi:papain like protease
MAEVLPDKPQRSYTWGVPMRLDQGAEGACVGFAWAHELAARPRVHTKVMNGHARIIYRRAKQLDEWPGEDYEGTSILAGAKTAKEMNYVNEYRWCFSLSDLILTIGYLGPVVLGLNWYTDQMDTDSNGYIHPNGVIEGGHAILCNGVNVKSRSFLLTNSWGRAWGRDGQCRITWSDMWQLLSEQGEACVPVGRKWVQALR